MDAARKFLFWNVYVEKVKFIDDEKLTRSRHISVCKEDSRSFFRFFEKHAWMFDLPRTGCYSKFSERKIASFII